MEKRTQISNVWNFFQEKGSELTLRQFYHLNKKKGGLDPILD